ncbi:MAG: substrate-binding domain-containing protein [Bacteroidales bacterium]|nr:substrate-binding domain-containing protein [Bacteroidales bacterium]MCD8394339.1 substrate-binding domain-containing protein [Bacteroidales bacterium]
MSKRHIFRALAVTLVALAFGACTKFSDKPKGVTSTSGVTILACDESFQNIIEQEIGVFEYIYPDVSVLPYYLNEKACVDSLMSLHVPSAVLARELTPEETAYLTANKKKPKTSRIAVDAIALIVNPANPIEILSINEIREILTGQVTEWNQLEPSKLGKISVVFDNEGSSTVQYMKDSLMRGEKFADNVYAQATNPEVFKAVQNNKNAIGIIGVSWVSADMNNAAVANAESMAKSLERNDTTVSTFDSSIKVLKIRRDDSIEAYQPYQAYIFDGRYPLYRSIYMVTTGVGGTPSHGFYSFVTGFQGQKIIMKTGILPAVVHPRMVNVE